MRIGRRAKMRAMLCHTVYALCGFVLCCQHEYCTDDMYRKRYNSLCPR